MNNVVPRYDTALRIFRYHKGQNHNADPKWADGYLLRSVEVGYITQDEADRIKIECGLAVQAPLFKGR